MALPDPKMNTTLSVNIGHRNFFVDVGMVHKYNMTLFSECEKKDQELSNKIDGQIGGICEETLPGSPDKDEKIKIGICLFIYKYLPKRNL